jgi:hypothetical protein
MNGSGAQYTSAIIRVTDSDEHQIMRVGTKSMEWEDRLSERFKETDPKALNSIEVVNNYQITGSDEVVLCNATSWPLTLILPEITTVYGKLIRIKKIDSTSNSIIIQQHSENTDIEIDGSTSNISLTDENEAITLYADEETNGWYIL